MNLPARAFFPFLLASLLAAEETAPGLRVLCTYDQKLCGDYDVLNLKLDQPTAVDNNALSELNAELLAFERRIDGLCGENGPAEQLGKKQQEGIEHDRGVLREKLNEMTLTAAPKEVAAISQQLLEVEKLADKLFGDSTAASRETSTREDFARLLKNVNQRATEIWKQLHALSLNVDRMGDPVIGFKTLTPSGRLWNEQLNPLEGRIAELRDRLKKIAAKSQTRESAGASRPQVDGNAIGQSLKKKSLSVDPFTHGSAEKVPTNDIGAADDQSPPAGVNLTVSPKTLLDIRTPPKVARPTGDFEINGGAVIMGDRNIGGRVPIIGGEDAFPKKTSSIRFLHKIGWTKTVGDPAGRARYVFDQTGGTCALASQAEIYAEIHGVEPTLENLKNLENAFFARARREKTFGGNSASHEIDQRITHGVPDEYVGDMLDAPVKKHFLAKDEELIAAVKTGKMVHISVRAGLLWNNRKFEENGHAIVLTALEQNRLTGRVVGFYVNDTGVDPPEGGRFVTTQQLLPAWHEQGSIFTEAL